MPPTTKPPKCRPTTAVAFGDAANDVRVRSTPSPPPCRVTGQDQAVSDDETAAAAAARRGDRAQQVERHRERMTVLHYVLTYPRWSLSLFCVLAAVILPLPLPHEVMRMPLQNLHVYVVQPEANDYLQCVQHSFVSLDMEMARRVQVEQARAEALQAHNAAVVLEAQEHAQDCQVATDTVRRALQAWQQGQGLVQTNNASTLAYLPLRDNSTVCDLLDQDNLVRYWQQQTPTAVAEQANGVLDGYVMQVQESMQRVADYVTARTQYDYEYFIDVKLRGVGDLLDNFTLDGPLIDDLDWTAIQANISLAIRPMTLALQDAHVRISLLMTRLSEFYDSLRAFYDNYVDIFDRLSQASAFVRDFLPDRIPMPDYLDMRGIPTADFLLPMTFEMPTFGADLPDLGVLVNTTIHDLVAVVSTALQEQLQAVSSATRERVAVLAKLIQDQLTLEDYDPPRFQGSRPYWTSVADEMAALQQQGMAVSTHWQSTFDRLQSTWNSTVTNTSMLDANATTLPRVDGPQTLFGYLQPSLPGWSVPRALATLVSVIAAYQWLIESVIQIMRLMSIKRKYERNALPDLPEIDFSRQSDDQDIEEASAARWALVQQAILTHLLSPWLMMGIILLPLVIVAVAVWFPHIHHSCVATREGTAIARHLLVPLFINQASVAGNLEYAKAEMTCRQKQRQLCDSLYADSDRIFREHQWHLETAQAEFEPARAVYDAMDHCLLMESLDDTFETSCCGLQGYATDCDVQGDPITCPIDQSPRPPSAYLPVGTVLSNANKTCQTDVKAMDLVEAHYDCTSLENLCSTSPCHGVNADWIKAMTIEADCEAETYIMNFTVFVLLIIYHAVTVNASCSLAFYGIRHLQWRQLQPDSITLKTCMTEDGSLVHGANVAERSQRVAVAMRRFERMGWIQLAGAALLTALWLLSFAILRHVLRPLR